MTLRHLDLFSGIGGFALAVRWLGHETVGFCDNDTYSQKLLAKKFPGVPIHDDIRNLRGTDLGAVDLITGGFPCQPFSVAGNQRGSIDDRHLWPEMARVIDECRPRYVLGENVAGIVKMELDSVISDLEAIGYTARAIAVPAVGTDAPHIRQRIWIMAHDDRCAEGSAINTWKESSTATVPELCGEDVADTESQRHERTGDSWAGRAGSTNSGTSLADTNSPRQQSGTKRRDRPWDGTRHDGSNATHAHSAGQQEQWWAEPGGEELAASEQHCIWPVEPGMGRVAHGIPGRVDRLRGLGNAIVPAVAYEILRVMIGEAE